MFQNLNEQIVRVKGDIRKKGKFEKQLTDYENELQEVEDTIKNVSEQLEKEKKDVQKLEGISITNLISSIVGTKYERLDKEEKEVAAVQLQLEEAKKTKHEIVDEMTVVHQKRKLVMNSEQEYQELLQTKEALIKDSNSDYSDKLFRLDEEEADVQAYLTELGEAITAGENVKWALLQAIDSLQSAKGWGTWDMVGGGMISSAIKHDHIDQATDQIHIAQSKMRKFQKELLDVNEVAAMHVDMSGLLKFADFFFDGFIVDWMVQGRINDSLQQTKEQLSHVNNILSKLKSQEEQSENNLNQLKIDKKNVIETL
ncbi:hypothetical protein ACFSTA_15545 [Ornithinibacillus salinisoli]|uniref:Uncharacterized protein n=1 Tax=Ornithinibacillus salinisoli TaxID=1848459 RepID=A0ABW4W0K3_9BACI